MQHNNNFLNTVKQEIFYCLKTIIPLLKYKESSQTRNMIIWLLFIEAKNLVFV